MLTGAVCSDQEGREATLTIANETLPSLAFGMSSCSLKWKADPQDKYLMGARSGPAAQPAHPIWVIAQTCGERIVKLIGYDCGRADMARARRANAVSGAFDFAYPLQMLGWTRDDCVRAIESTLGPDFVPLKSAC